MTIYTVTELAASYGDQLGGTRTSFTLLVLYFLYFPANFFDLPLIFSKIPADTRKRKEEERERALKSRAKRAALIAAFFET